MITINNLSFSYSKEPVLDHISTRFETGRVYGLLGSNGVGKSSLFKMICGLLTSKEGSIDVDGYSPAQRKANFYSKIYYIPEDFSGPAMSVKNFALGNGIFYPNFDRDLFFRLMKEFELDPEKKFTELSLGQHKRVILAYALSLKTEYLLLDEPTNGLDIPAKSEFRKILSSVIDEKQTVIISTHQVRDVENLLDHIIILDKRAVLLDKSIDEIQKEYYFDNSPYQPEDALYCESGLGGYSFVRKNTEGAESKINIEILFNYINSTKNSK